MIKNNFLLIISLITLNLSYSQSCNGDSNNDSIVNVLDIITAVTHVLEEDIISGIAFDNTDLNNDGSIDILDVIAITSLILNGASTCEDLDIPLDLSLGWEIQEDVSYFNYESLENTMGELSNLSSFYGIIVLHNGKIVGERYNNSGGIDVRYNIWSVTKSYISTLIGQAIDQGYLPNVNTTLNNVLSDDYDQDYLSEITLKNVLTMSTGYYDFYGYPYWFQQPTSNLVNMPYSFPNSFYYNNSACHLSSHILYYATGMTPMEFAEENLFPYIGIENPYWFSGYNGINDGSASLHLNLREMIKLGQLYLQNGYSGNEQILSTTFIQDATTFQINTGGFGYGYLWWLDNETYIAIGLGGQLIAVFPELNLVIGTNSLAYSSQSYQNQLFNYVLSVIPNLFY